MTESQQSLPPGKPSPAGWNCYGLNQRFPTVPNLTPSQRRFLRAQAHHLHPVVQIGNAGLSPAVKKEINLGLHHHELIKIKIAKDNRGAREKLLTEICDAFAAAPVQQIGKILIVYRAGVEPKIALPG
jgi:RNA-binding protein